MARATATRAIALAFLACAACYGKQAPARSNGTAPESATAEQVSEEGCSDGKVTLVNANSKGAEVEVLFCRDGAPFIAVREEYGEDVEEKVEPTTMALWQRVWRAADDANWKGQDDCKTSRAAIGVHLVIEREGVTRELPCAASDFPCEQHGQRGGPESEFRCASELSPSLHAVFMAMARDEPRTP